MRGQLLLENQRARERAFADYRQALGELLAVASKGTQQGVVDIDENRLGAAERKLSEARIRLVSLWAEYESLSAAPEQGAE